MFAYSQPQPDEPLRLDSSQRRETASRSKSQAPDPTATTGRGDDPGDRSRVERQLKIQQAYFRQLFENSPEGIAILDTEDRVVDANQAFERLFGYRPEEIRGKRLNELIVPAHLHGEASELSRKVRSRRVVDHETVRLRKDGSRVEVSVLGCPIEIDDRQIGVFGIYRDFTSRKRHERRLEYLARFDALTNLPNRSLFEERIEQELARAESRGRIIAIHYLDLDNFKNVNDTLGHRVGDKLLRAVAERLARLVPETDTVARLGGDEFALVQTNLTGPTPARALARQVLDTLARPFKVGTHLIHTSATIGIALSTPGADAGELMSQADTALHKTKERGRRTFQFHNEEMAAELQDYVALHHDLHRALAEREFFIEYQPQIALDTGEIIGAEALVRWQHPERGLLQPAEFIPVTESSGLIVPLGAWVLREACRQRRAWSDAGLPEFPVAVNLSAVQFKDPQFADRVAQCLADARLEPELLHLELTESILMEGSRIVTQALERLNEQRVRFVIDDFGTGYSSLRYLRAFPFHKLKIAMEFVQHVSTDSDDASIVDAVISLGHKLGLKVIAEGVDADEQVDFLRAHSCDEVQGFRFSRPLKPEMLVRLLRRSVGDP